MTILRVNTIAGIGSTHFGTTLSGNIKFNSQNYVVLPKGTSTQSGVLRETSDVVGTGGTYYDNLVLAMPFNAATGLCDVSSRNRNPGAYGNVGIATTTSKYYGSSAKFDGNADWIDFVGVGSDFNLGTGDFTIEAWIYSTTNSLDNFYRRIYMTDGPTGNAVGNFQIAIEPTTGKLNLWENSGALDLLGTSNITNGSWNHISACRSGTTLRLFVNGTSENSTTYSTAVTANSGQPRPRIGNYDGASGSGDYDGYLQDLRVYKGIAKYTANFTPPDRIAEVGVGFTTGQLRYNTDSNRVELYDGNQWTQVQMSQVGLGTGGDTGAGARGIFGGGLRTATPGAVIDGIDYINIASTGNSISFGTLSATRRLIGGCASATRAVFGGGFSGAAANVSTIEFVTISSTGNVTSFGSLTEIKRGLSGLANSTRGLFLGGSATPTPTVTNTIEYITISSTGNGVDFGDLTQARTNTSAAGSPTRGMVIGGETASVLVNTIDYVTISTLGHAFDFGDLTQNRGAVGSFSNPTRSVFGGGEIPGTVGVNTIDYATIATLGNAVNFGNLTRQHRFCATASSSTRGVFAGGANDTPVSNTAVNTIDYVTILTQGNAVDFGDLTLEKWQMTIGNVSNAHGGL